MLAIPVMLTLAVTKLNVDLMTIVPKLKNVTISVVKIPVWLLEILVLHMEYVKCGTTKQNASVIRDSYTTLRDSVKMWTNAGPRHVAKMLLASMPLAATTAAVPQITMKRSSTDRLIACPTASAPKEIWTVPQRRNALTSVVYPSVWVSVTVTMSVARRQNAELLTGVQFVFAQYSTPATLASSASPLSVCPMLSVQKIRLASITNAKIHAKCRLLVEPMPIVPLVVTKPYANAKKVSMAIPESFVVKSFFVLTTLYVPLERPVRTRFAEWTVIVTVHVLPMRSASETVVPKSVRVTSSVLNGSSVTLMAFASREQIIVVLRTQTVNLISTATKKKKVARIGV